MAAAANGEARAALVARYDQLLQEFGEDPFHASSVCSRAEGVAPLVDAAASDEARKALLLSATEKSLRSAELIQRVLEVASEFTHVQQQLAKAMKSEQDDEDDDEDEDMEEEQDTAEVAVLMEDLISVGEELQETSKSYSQLGVAQKSARASRELVSMAEHNLDAFMESVTQETPMAQENDEFRDLYMNEFTSAFGDELDQFRQEERFESKDVTYLISCIHAGGDIFSPLQKKLFVESVRASNDKQ